MIMSRSRLSRTAADLVFTSGARSMTATSSVAVSTSITTVTSAGVGHAHLHLLDDHRPQPGRLGPQLEDARLQAGEAEAALVPAVAGARAADLRVRSDGQFNPLEGQARLIEHVADDGAVLPALCQGQRR